MQPNLSVLLLALGVGAIHVALGVAVGWWLRRPRHGVDSDPTEARRAKRLIEWLAQLRSTIDDDVQQHQTSIQEIGQQLEALDLGTATPNENVPLTNMVISIVGEIIETNHHLQDRLACAKVELQQKQAEIESQQSLALTDSLTKLPNRRAFDDDLNRCLAACRQNAGGLSLVLIDVDHFKTLNDGHGHQAGDKVLKQLAGVLRRSLRSIDLVARFGGEEFAAILPDADGDAAKTVAQHCLEAIRSATFEFEGVKLAITASAGVATITTEDEDDATLVKRADLALYASKDAGRDCVHFHNGRWSEFVDTLQRTSRPPDGLFPTAIPVSKLSDLEEACHALRLHATALADH